MRLEASLLAEVLIVRCRWFIDSTVFFGRIECGPRFSVYGALGTKQILFVYEKSGTHVYPFNDVPGFLF